MKCLVSDTIENNRNLFAEIPYRHVYQSYEVLCAAEKAETRAFYFQCLKRPWNLICKPKFRLYQVWKDDKMVLMAPLRIDGDEANMVGHTCDMNYTDFLYGDVSDEDLKGAVECLFGRLKNDGIRSLSCLRLADDSEFLKTIAGCYKVRFDSKSVCIDLGLEGHEKYFSALGKHAKQNVRTAYNRLARDNFGFDLLTFSMCGIGNSMSSQEGQYYLETCKKLYQERQMKRYGMSNGLLIKLLGTKMGGVILSNMNYASLSMTSSKSLMTVLLIDGKIGAFMHGFYNEGLKSFEVPKLAMNEEYSWYSPGLVLVNETAKKFIEDGHIQYIDLTRGTEKYKTDMGGQFYETHAITIKL